MKCMCVWVTVCLYVVSVFIVNNLGFLLVVLSYLRMHQKQTESLKYKISWGYAPRSPKCHVLTVLMHIDPYTIAPLILVKTLFCPP